MSWLVLDLLVVNLRMGINLVYHSLWYRNVITLDSSVLMTETK